MSECFIKKFKGMIHLLYCNHALTAAQQALEILGKRGINDKAEKVRLSAFKLLNHLIGHRSFKVTTIFLFVINTFIF